MKLLQGESHVIGRFIESSRERGLVLARREDDELIEDNSSIEKLLADYFGIDLKIISREKDAMVEEIRSLAHKCP